MWKRSGIHTMMPDLSLSERRKGVSGAVFACRNRNREWHCFVKIVKCYENVKNMLIFPRIFIILYYIS